jgi:hypothetical protein
MIPVGIDLIETFYYYHPNINLRVLKIQRSDLLLLPQSEMCNQLKNRE